MCGHRGRGTLGGHFHKEPITHRNVRVASLNVIRSFSIVICNHKILMCSPLIIILDQYIEMCGRYCDLPSNVLFNSQSQRFAALYNNVCPHLTL